MPDGPPLLEVTEISRLTFPPAIRLFEFYAEQRAAADGLPVRSAFSQPAMQDLGVLANMYILSPVDGGHDWVYRLIGTGICYRYKEDRSWQTFRDFLSAENAERIIALNNEIVRSGEPRFFNLLPREIHLGWLTLETMSLPILSDDGAETWLLGGTFFSDEHGS